MLSYQYKDLDKDIVLDKNMTKKSNIYGKCIAIYEMRYLTPGTLWEGKDPSQVSVSNINEKKIARIG